MSTLKYGITCSYFATVLNFILAVVMFSVFLRLYGSLIPDFILDMLDPVTQWIYNLEILDFDQYISHVVYRNADLYSLLLTIGSVLLLVASLMMVLGLSNYNRLRKAAAWGLVGSIIVYSEFRYCGNETFALIVLTLFFNISVVMAIPKITKESVDNARQGVVASGDLVFNEKKSSPSEIKKDLKALSKIHDKMDRLGEKMFEEIEVGAEHREDKKTVKSKTTDSEMQEESDDGSEKDNDSSKSVKSEEESVPDVTEPAQEGGEETEGSADSKKPEKKKHKRPSGKKKK